MRLCLAMLLICLLGACSAPEPPLRVGLLDWPPHAMALLANRLGYYDEVQFDFVEFRSSAEVARAYEIGGLDIIALTVDYVVELGGRMPDNRAFLIIDESRGGDAAISREPLGALGELAGKRIGLELSELGAHFLSRLLNHAALTLDDVETVYIDIPDHLVAFANDDADVIITFEPMRSKLLAAGGHELFSSTAIPGEIVDIFMARQSVIARRQADFRVFTGGWFKALDYYRKNRSEAIEILAEETLLPAAELELMLDGVRMIPRAENYRLLAGDNALFIESINRFLQSGTAGLDETVSEALPSIFTDAALPALED